ncbi:MAG: hypothetical protein WAO76_09210 [Georgfuchsia sp.]
MNSSTTFSVSEWGAIANLSDSELRSVVDTISSGDLAKQCNRKIDWDSIAPLEDSSKSSLELDSEQAISRKRKYKTTSVHIPHQLIGQQSDLLAEWDGIVTEIREHYFTASLSGIFGEGVEEEAEEAEIPVSDVNKSELDLFRLGSVFRLCVFYEELPNGQPRRFTQVVFRRLPAYRSRDIRAAEERAELIHQHLRVE